MRHCLCDNPFDCDRTPSAIGSAIVRRYLALPHIHWCSFQNLIVLRRLNCTIVVVQCQKPSWEKSQRPRLSIVWLNSQPQEPLSFFLQRRDAYRTIATICLAWATQASVGVVVGCYSPENELAWCHDSEVSVKTTPKWGADKVQAI